MSQSIQPRTYIVLYGIDNAELHEALSQHDLSTVTTATLSALEHTQFEMPDEYACAFIAPGERHAMHAEVDSRFLNR